MEAQATFMQPVLHTVTVTMTAEDAARIHRVAGALGMDALIELITDADHKTISDLDVAVYELYRVLDNIDEIHDIKV